jgi:hypothetical protein
MKGFEHGQAVDLLVLEIVFSLGAG